MPINPLYMVTLSIEEYFVDPSTGTPLSGGFVYFYVDNNRNQLKPVYQLTGAPPNYTYTALPNPMQLSGVGTFEYPVGTNIAIYYYPYDDFGNVQNYYIAVYAAGTPPPGGTPILTREAWPNIPIDSSAIPGQSTVSTDNQLSNPQFIVVGFDPNTILTISYNTGTTTTEIAPGWLLEIIADGSGVASVAQNVYTGSSAHPTNPPYSISITAGNSIEQMNLIQRLTHNPGIWSQTNPPVLSGAYIAGSMALAPSTGTVIMYYSPNSGTEQEIMAFSNGPGLWQEFNATVPLIVSDNPTLSTTGYVDILLSLPVVGTTTLSSIQAVGTNSAAIVPFDQEPVNRQIDHLFHYYQPQLNYKPIPSYLVGWDFPVNPAQFFGDTVPAQALGANTSYYAWDQTILFQSLTSGITVARDDNGGMELTCASAGTQIAVVQYLDQATAREILGSPFSIGVNGYTSLASLNGFVSVYAMIGALPDLTANNSIVATLNPSGTVATRHGTWTQLTRTGQASAEFEFGLPTLTTNFSYWDYSDDALATTATFFAIVLSFPALAHNDTVTLNWISLQAGKIATKPSPQSLDQALSQSERFYEMSYESATDIATGTSVNALMFPQSVAHLIGTSTQSAYLASSFFIPFKTEKRVDNPIMNIYSSNTGTIGNVDVYMLGQAATHTDVAITRWALTTGNKYVNYLVTNNTLTPIENSVNTATPNLCSIGFQFVADARLGIVV